MDQEREQRELWGAVTNIELAIKTFPLARTGYAGRYHVGGKPFPGMQIIAWDTTFIAIARPGAMAGVIMTTFVRDDAYRAYETARSLDSAIPGEVHMPLMKNGVPSDGFAEQLHIAMHNVSNVTLYTNDAGFRVAFEHSIADRCDHLLEESEMFHPGCAEMHLERTGLKNKVMYRCQGCGHTVTFPDTVSSIRQFAEHFSRHRPVAPRLPASLNRT